MGLKPAVAPQTDVSCFAVLDLQQQWHRQTPLEGDAPAQNLSVEDRAIMERRFKIIEPLISREKSQEVWSACGGWRLKVAAWIAGKHGVPARTVRHWEMNYRRHGMMGLVNRDRADKGTFPSLNRAARNLIVRLAIGKLRISEQRRIYEDERVWRDEHVGERLHGLDAKEYAPYLDEDGRLSEEARLSKISAMTQRRFVETIPEPVRTLARDGKEAYRNTQEIISHRDIAAVKPMDFCVMDHRMLDIAALVRDRGAWRLVRPWLTAAIDMRTRKWLAWAIVETPSSDSIATVLKRVFLNYGLPGALYWDNGKDFTCEWFEGRRPHSRHADPIPDLDGIWRGVLGTLGIRVIHAIIRNARAKLIEPNFLRVAGIDRQLPEYCGHKPDARPEGFADLVKQHEAWLAGQRESTPFRTIEEVASLYSAALHDLNEHHPLEGDGMRKLTPTGHAWLTPNEAWDLLIGQVERRAVPADVLQHCFAKRRELTVHHGELSMTFAGRPYFYRLADNSLRLQLLNGKCVQLAYDPLDLGAGAVYYEDRFFGLVHCIPLRRQGEQAFVADERDRRAARRQVKQAIAAIQTIAPAPSLEQRLARRAETTPPREDVSRVEIPAAIAAPVMEAAQAARTAAAPPEAITVEKLAAADADDDDGSFSFFGIK